MNLPLDSTARPTTSPARQSFQLRAVTGVAVLSALGMLLGYARDAGLAAVFGASGTTDAFFVATIIPTIIATVVLSGALAPTILPVFAGLLQSKETAWSMANAILTLMLGVLGLLVLCLIVSAHLLVTWLAPGFGPTRAELATRLVIITAPSVAFLGLGALLGALLNALGEYNVPALEGMLVNGLTFGGIVLGARTGGVEGAAWGLVLGGLLQLVLQFVVLRRHGWVYRPGLNLRQPAVREVFRLFVPLVLFVALAQAVPILERIIASGFSAGQLSQLTYAGKLYQIPGVILSSSVAIVLFPTLARSQGAGNQRDYVETLRGGIRQVIFLTIPLALWFFFAANPIVKLVLEHGAFSASDTAATGDLLRWYSVAVVPAGVLLVLQRAFHARRDMVTPLLIGLLITLPYIAGAILLSRSIGISGLPIAFAIAQCGGLVISILILSRRLKRPVGELFGKDLLLICLAGLVLLLLILPWSNLLVGSLAASSPASLAAALVLSILFSGLLYLGFARMLGIAEAKVLLEWLTTRIPRKPGGRI